MIEYLAVFAAGLVSSLSPCVIITYPLVIGYVGGYAEGDIKKSAWYSFLFSLGLSVTFTFLGAIAALTGSLLGDVGSFWKYILSFVAVYMGLQLSGLLKLPVPTFQMGRVKQKGGVGAFLIGLLFGLATSPCATPTLAVVLTYVASTKNFLYGISLLFVYSLAHTAVIFLLGISTGLAEGILKNQKVQSLTALSQRLSGWIFMAIGILILIYMR